MDASVLIFGINGFVGSYLTTEFASHGYEVMGSDQADTCRLDSVSYYRKANLLDSLAVEEIILDARPSCIVNLAAISSVGLSWKIPQATMSVNIVGVLNILEAARKLDARPRIMLIGSSEEYASSDVALSEESPLCSSNPYGVSKSTQERLAEIYADRYGMKIFRIRAFNHTGIGQSETFVLPSFCRQAAEIDLSGKSGTIHVGNLNVRRDFSDVRDIVRAYRMVIESDYAGEVFNVGSDTAHLLSELLNLICSFCSQDITVEVDKDRLRPIDVPLIVCDSGKIKRLVGWKPEYTIEQTLKSMVENYTLTL